jgi:aryl-alcohol dehydrogenase-like predicted oxidoreductase
LSDKDIRRGMPRFDASNLPANLKLFDRLKPIAADNRCSTTQLVLAWLLAHAKQVLPIPGTASEAHLEENVAAADITLSAADLAHMERIVNPQTVAGARYPAATQAEIDAG